MRQIASIRHAEVVIVEYRADPVYPTSSFIIIIIIIIIMSHYSIHVWHSIYHSPQMIAYFKLRSAIGFAI
jgi:hypothetical protein